MKVLALSASNSSASINQELIKYVASLLEVPCDVISLRDYNIPMFSVDEESLKGFSVDLRFLARTFKNYDGYIISIPEHDGNFPAFFKNIVDWFTRIERGFFREKPVLLLNAAPGSNGGESVLKIAENSFPFFAANIIGTFRLPEFGSFFREGRIEINDAALMSGLTEVIDKFESSLKEASTFQKLL